MALEYPAAAARVSLAVVLAWVCPPLFLVAGKSQIEASALLAVQALRVPTSVCPVPDRRPVLVLAALGALLAPEAPPPLLRVTGSHRIAVGQSALLAVPIPQVPNSA